MLTGKIGYPGTYPAKNYLPSTSKNGDILIRVWEKITDATNFKYYVFNLVLKLIY
jgi:hypothetical protein